MAPETGDFSRNVSVYDERHGAFLCDAAARRLMVSARLNASSQVLEIGAGTGRVSISVARYCRITSVDLSHAMLTSMRAKASDVKMNVIVADAQHLPFRSRVFDAIVFARIMYLLRDWRDVITSGLRLLKPAGVVLHEWGNGTSGDEWAKIRDKARELFEAAGVREPFHPGARFAEEVDAHFRASGLVHETEHVFEPDVRMTLGEFVARIARDECSYTWKLPVPLRQQLVTQLYRWAHDNFDMAHVVDSPMVWQIYRATP